MAKRLIKVKIKRNRTDKTSYTYPGNFLDYAPKFQVLAYESGLAGGFDKVVGRGDKDEFVTGFVNEEDLPIFLAIPDVEEIDRKKAEKFLGEDLEKTVVKVLNSDSVIVALAKKVKGETLTVEENKLLDPTNTASGIIEKRPYKDALDEHGIV